MQIIDFAAKGNVVRFFLGENGKQWGDDWNDAPYEHNAEEVYDEYVQGTRDIAFPFDDLVLEPCSGEWNSPWTKQDMIKRKIPCIIVVSPEARDSCFDESFARYVGSDSKGVRKYYFGDDMEPDTDTVTTETD